jgi:hypothetical protein
LVTEIRALNPTIDINKISPGQRITLPIKNTSDGTEVQVEGDRIPYPLKLQV